MKAFLLAAGLGSRLRPLTDSVPKCLVPIKGKPLLAWWLELMKRHRISEVLINTCYLHEQVEHFLKGYDGGVKVTQSYEPELLGSAGTISNNLDFIKDEDNFYVLYADNLTNVDLSKLLQFHINKHSLFTMGMFRTNKPKECGIATINKETKIIEFEEKPALPKSNLANAGIYIVNKSIVPVFESENPFDIGKDVLPKLINNIYGYEISDYLIDIGSMDNYISANKEWIGL